MWTHTTIIYTQIWLQCIHKMNNVHCRQCTLIFDKVACTMHTEIDILYTMYTENQNQCGPTPQERTLKFCYSAFTRCIMYTTDNVHYNSTNYTEIRRHYIHNVHSNPTTLYTQCTLKSDNIVYTMYTEIRRHYIHNVY